MFGRLLIPVEIKAREFDAKILFSCFAAERGYEVLIGQRQSLYRDVLPVSCPGVLIEHDVTAAHKSTFPDVMKFGHAIVAWDEEGLVQPTPSWYVSRRISADVMSMTQYHFAWGREQAEWIAKACPDLACRLVSSGNPRMDLLRPEFVSYLDAEADTYRERYGEYILINSNFNRVNLFHGQREAFIASVAKSAGLKADMLMYYREFIEHSERTFHAYIAMLSTFARRFSDRQIIVRPHPAEDAEPWRKAAEGLPNLHVIYEGTANGWISGAAALVHSGCTTAIEAAVLGVPVIEFAPNDVARFVLPLPRLVSELADSFESLCAMLESILSEASIGNSLADPDFPLHSHVSGLKGRFASDTILDHLAKIKLERGDFLFRLEKRSRFYLGRLIGRPRTRQSSGVMYARHKFPETSVAEVEKTIKSFQRASHRFGELRIKKIAANCFCISQ